MAGKRRKGKNNEEVHERHCNTSNPQARATRHTNPGGFPHRGGGSQTAHRTRTRQNDAGTEEANTGNNLCGDTRGIYADQICGEHIVEAILGDHHEESRGHANDRIRA